MKNQDSCFKFLKVGALTILISFSLAGCDKCVDDSKRFDALADEYHEIWYQLDQSNGAINDCSEMNAKLLEIDDAYDEICDPEEISSNSSWWAYDGQSVGHACIQIEASSWGIGCQ